MSTHDTNDWIERPREEAGPDVRRSGWHRVNVGHLVMGAAFLGLATVWALVTSDTVQLENAHWLLPLPWLVAGAIGLVATLLRGSRPHPHSVRMKGWIHNSPDSRD